jgi:ATP-binding cassette subfamily B protein
MGGPGWVGMLPPTPELLAKVDALPAIADQPQVEVAAEIKDRGPFSLNRFTKPYRKPLLLGAFLVVLDTLATLAGPALVRVGIDRGVLQHSEQALWAASGALLLVVILDWIDSVAVSLVTGKTSERLLFALRARIFAHLQRLALDYYDREMAGRIMTRMTTDVEALSNLLQTGLINALVSLLSFVGVAAALLYYNAELALVSFTVMPFLFAATWWFRNRSRLAYDEARERIAVVNANLQENLSGVRVAQAYVREDRNEAEFRRLSGQYVESRVYAQRLVAVYFPFVEMLSEVAAAVVLGVGTGLVHSHSLTAGELIAFLLYLDLLFSPIQQLSQVFDAYQQARASMSRITELMATPVLTPLAAEPRSPGRVRGQIEFEGVRFRYPGTASLEEALRGIDLEITPGETVALVGETGAGKSTIVKLVARFYDPTAGRVLIDGVPLTELDLGEYRRRLGYVPQEAFLFTGTIRDNIAYGRPSASDAEIEAAARAVGAHDFVAGLPGGYLHPVAEKGRSLSSGQRQLIALARAQLVDPSILLLDEATSNLDLATEARVARAMGVVASGRTTILIAHRLQTARAADRIVVLDEGLIVQSGSHEDLLADRAGPYARLWRAFAVEAVPVSEPEDVSEAS